MPISPISHSTSAAATLAANGKAAALRNLPQSEQVKAAAGQFEAIILRSMLQDSVGKLTGGDQAGGGMYGYMLTDVLANKLSEGGGLGLAKILEQQLSPHAKVASAATLAKGTP